MRKFHRNIIKFSVACFLLLFSAEVLLYNNLKTNTALKYEEIFDPKENANLIFIGTSHTANAINPCLINIEGVKPYNFCFKGSSPSYYLKWYRNIFRSNYPKPDRIVYGLDWAMFDSLWVVRTIDMDIRYMPLKYFFYFLIHDDDLSRKSLLYNRSNILYNSKQLQHLFFKKNIVEKLDITSYCLGYTPQVIKHPVMGMSPEKSPVSRKNINAFFQLLDEFEKDSIEVIFINVPDYIPSWQTESIEARYIYLDSVANARNIPFLNYNQDLKSEMNYDESLYSNWIHFNDKGATKFSKVLARDLEEKVIRNGI